MCIPHGVQTGWRHPAPCLIPFGASHAPPGAVVFHRFLHDINRTTPDTPRRRVELDRVDWSCAADRSGTPATPGQGPGLLPALGELLPVDSQPRTRAVTELRFINRAPATSRMIDVIA